MRFEAIGIVAVILHRELSFNIGYEMNHLRKELVDLAASQVTDTGDEKIVSVIVKIWIDAVEIEQGEADWHGLVTHVPSSERRYIKYWDQLTAFVAPYLIGAGVSPQQATRYSQPNSFREGDSTMADIKLDLALTVTDGPTIKLSRSMKVDAYERIDFDLRSGQKRFVEVEPDQDLVLMIVKRSEVAAGEFKPDPKLLYYTINDDATKVSLESAHVLVGWGVDKLLKNPPTKLTFYNNQENTVSIMVLLGRNIAEATKNDGASSAGTSSGGSSTSTTAGTSRGDAGQTGTTGDKGSTTDYTGTAQETQEGI